MSPKANDEYYSLIRHQDGIIWNQLSIFLGINITIASAIAIWLLNDFNPTISLHLMLMNLFFVAIFLINGYWVSAWFRNLYYRNVYIQRMYLRFDMIYFGNERIFSSTKTKWDKFFSYNYLPLIISSIWLLSFILFSIWFQTLKNLPWFVIIPSLIISIIFYLVLVRQLAYPTKGCEIRRMIRQLGQKEKKAVDR